MVKKNLLFAYVIKFENQTDSKKSPAIGFQEFTIGMLTPLKKRKIVKNLGGVIIRQPTLLL